MHGRLDPENRNIVLNSAISALWKDNDCSIDALPNHILVPVEQFGALVTRKVSDDSEQSILSYVLENKSIL